MAVPSLAHKLPFFLLDPATLSVPPMEAAVHETAETIARKGESASCVRWTLSSAEV